MLPLTLTTSDYEHFCVRTEEGGVAYEFDGATAAGRAFPGDEVRLVPGGVELAAHSGGMHGRRYATVELARRAQTKLFLVGTLELNSKSRYGITSRGVLRYKFLPYDAAYPPFFVGCSSKDTTRNLLVRIQFDDWPASSTCPIGVLVHTFGPAGDLAAEEEALLVHYGPLRWRREDVPVLPEAGGLPPLTPSSVAYTDSTDLCTFHVDPPGCRDIDDAISFKPVEGSSCILVKIHIADVTSWLKAYPVLAGPAAAAGQTLYRDGVAVRPMFPVTLSEGVMSLLPGELRRAWTLNFLWSSRACQGNPWWTHDEIRVKESYTYESILGSPHADLLGDIASSLAGRPLTDPHEWIEHVMLFYNRSVAEELKRRGVGVLRRHAAPDLARLEAMRRLNLPASVGDRLAMRAGEYCLAAEEDTVHWGLGAAVYCHASSPIRRWADCVNQTALAAVLHNYLDAEPTPFQVVASLNAAARRAKRYERDLGYVRALLGPAAARAHAGTVLEAGRIWVPYLDRLVRADTGDRQAGEAVEVRFFADAGKRNWKGRLVVRVEGGEGAGVPA
jgi:exoribonuclease R